MREALEVERDAAPISGGGAEEAVEPEHDLILDWTYEELSIGAPRALRLPARSGYHADHVGWVKRSADPTPGCPPIVLGHR